jgi:hypothetical protein
VGRGPKAVTAKKRPRRRHSEPQNIEPQNRRTAEGRSEDLESKLFTFAFCGSTFDILRFAVSSLLLPTAYALYPAATFR